MKLVLQTKSSIPWKNKKINPLVILVRKINDSNENDIVNQIVYI